MSRKSEDGKPMPATATQNPAAKPRLAILKHSIVAVLMVFAMRKTAQAVMDFRGQDPKGAKLNFDDVYLAYALTWGVASMFMLDVYVLASNTLSTYACPRLARLMAVITMCLTTGGIVSGVFVWMGWNDWIRVPIFVPMFAILYSNFTRIGVHLIQTLYEIRKNIRVLAGARKRSHESAC